MTAVVVIALTVAAALILWEAWARLIRPDLPALTAAERRLAALAERTAQPLFTEAEKDTHVISDDFQAKLAQLGAAISTLKARAEAAEKALAGAPQPADLDQANQHIADLTSQVATLQAALDQANADKADELKAVADLADQAQPAA